jgi:hypothetical protein
MRKMKKLTLLLVLMLTARVDFVFGQASVSNAEIRGQVTDQNGAAVAGATVTVNDANKGTTRSVNTDENGSYVILALQPSTYNLKVEAAGFASKTLNDVKLDVGQVASIPVVLGVGAVQDVVDVTANAQVVEVERTQQSSVIGEVQIDNLPINRRSYLDFALLTPGVSDSDNINDTTDFRVAQTPQSGLSFGGNNGRGNSVMVDGASTDTNSGAVRAVLGQEAVQEFQVNRNSYNAEYGGAFGGVVNIVSKTGTNNWHGSLFGYFRNDIFDARNFFDQSPDGISPFNRQQFGGSFGGPVRKDKTFLFTAFEALKQRQTSFVNLLNDPTIFNLTSGQTALFSFLDGVPSFAPLSAGVRGAISTKPRTTQLFQDASGQFPFDSFDTVGSVRLDHTFNSNDSGYARFNVADAHFENQAAGSLTAVSRGRTINTFTSGVLLSQTHFFSPNTINEIKGQYSYVNNDVIPNESIGPEINIDGFGNFNRDIFLPSFAIERRYEISDGLSLVRGDHTFRLGGLYQAVNNSSDSQTFFGGRFNFTAQLTLIALVPAAVRTPLVTFLTGAGRADLIAVLNSPISSVQAFNANAPVVYQQGFGESHFNSYSHRTSFYGQDTWKVRRNFTLNFGARYYIEKNHDPMPTNKDNIQPRLGFAWDPWGDGKTAIRGGYGVFVGSIDNQIVNVVNELNSTGDPSNINIVLATATSNALPLSPANPLGPRAPSSIGIYQTLLAQGVIGNRVITAADLAQFGVVPGPGATLEVRFRVGPNYHNPYTQQASLAIQRDLGKGYGVEVSYLFSRGAHIPRNHDTNAFKATGPVSPLSGTPTFIRFPSAAQVAAGLTSDFRNPFRLQDNNYESTANSFYHAGTIQLTKRLSNHYALNANYTLSKTIDEVTDFNSDFSAQNQLDNRADRALSAFDQRHRFVFYGVFMSPVAGESMAHRLFKDWVLSPIFIAGSGRPFNVLLGIDANGDGVSTRDRPCLRTAADQPCNPNSNLGRNTGRGEPFYQVDLRLARRFTFAESKYVELTFEAFNLLNHTNFTGINNIIGATPLIDGHPTGIRGRAPTQPLGFTSAAPARQLQFGARFNF